MLDFLIVFLAILTIAVLIFSVIYEVSMLSIVGMPDKKLLDYVLKDFDYSSLVKSNYSDSMLLSDVWCRDVEYFSSSLQSVLFKYYVSTSRRCLPIWRFSKITKELDKIMKGQ